VKQITKVKKFKTKMSYQFNNQPDVLKINDSYSDFLAPPIEAYLSENMAINLRDETIPMACSCFLENNRNIQKENLVHSIQNSDLKQMHRSGKLLNYSSNIDLCREIDNKKNLLKRKRNEFS
jgi:hypothetical protein